MLKFQYLHLIIFKLLVNLKTNYKIIIFVIKISPFIFISSGGGKQPPNHLASKISSNGGRLWHLPSHICSQKKKKIIATAAIWRRKPTAPKEKWRREDFRCLSTLLLAK